MPLILNVVPSQCCDVMHMDSPVCPFGMAGELCTVLWGSAAGSRFSVDGLVCKLCTHKKISVPQLY